MTLIDHPLQYAYCRNVYVPNTEDMSDEDVQQTVPGGLGLPVERYNRCPVCEQWSPCDVRRGRGRGRVCEGEDVSVDETRDASSDPSVDEIARADMRIEIVKRELNQGALAGFSSEVTDHAAHLVIAALDSYDRHCREEDLAEEFRRGFDAAELNAMLRRTAISTFWLHNPCGRWQEFIPGPQAGVRCNGCGHPTDLREWEPGAVPV